MAKFILLLLGAGLVYDLYAFPWSVWFQQIGVLFWLYVLYALVRFLFTGPRLLYLVKGIVVGFVGLIVLMIGVGFDPSVDTSPSKDTAQQEQTAEKTAEAPQEAPTAKETPQEEKSGNPYDKYKNSDQKCDEVTSAILWNVYDKIPQVEQFVDEKKDIPFGGIIGREELNRLYKEGKFRRVTTKFRLIGENPYEFDDNGEYLYYSESLLGKTLNGEGMICKVIDGVIQPVYIGKFVGGRYYGYGMQFKTASGAANPKWDGVCLLEYDGYFMDGLRHGKGNLYNFTMASPVSAIAAAAPFTLYSGEFYKGKKDGKFLVYSQGEITEETYEEGKLVK